jgi:hypothetical protein
MNFSGAQTIQGGQTGTGTTTAYAPYVTQAWQYFRMVIPNIYGIGSSGTAEISEWYPVFTAGQNSSTNYGLTWTPTLQTGDAFNVTKNLTVTSAGTGVTTLPAFRPVSTGFTISIRFTLTGSITQYMRLFSAVESINSPNALFIYYNSSGTLGFVQYVNSVDTPANLISTTTCNIIGQEYHVVWTLDSSGNHRLYFNGVQDSTTGVGALNIVTYNQLYIGRSNFNEAIYPNMTVRDFRMFNRALNAAEVSALYHNTNYGQPAVGPLSLSGSGSHALSAIGSIVLLDGGNYLTAYQASNFAAPLLSGINAPIVATAVSYDGVYMVLVTSGTTNNVYYSTNYGATFTGLTIGSLPMIACAISYDGSYFTVSNETTVYRLNSNSTGFSIAIGSQAGQTNQAVNAIAIGNKAGQANQSDNSIILNATGTVVGTGVSGFYVAPIARIESSASASLSLLGYGSDYQIVQSGITILGHQRGVNGGISTQLDIAKGSIQATNYTHHHWNSAKLLPGFLVTSGTYWKIATVGPTTSPGCWGTLNIKGSLGGFFSDQCVHIDVSLSTRSGVVVNGQARCANLSNALQRMDLGYVWNGSVYEVYFYTTSSEYVSFDLDISGHQGSVSNVFLYDPSVTVPITQSPGVLSSLITACQMINQGSNIGIGTTNPQNTLHIRNTIADSTQAPDGAPSSGHILLTNSKSGISAYSMAIGIDQAYGIGYLNVAGNGSVQPLCLNTRGGNVGIGTTNPQTTLDIIGGTIRSEVIRVYRSAGGMSNTNLLGTIGFGDGDGNVTHAATIEGYGTYGGAGDQYGANIRFSTYSWSFPPTGLVERMRITDQGRVGIGITNPSYKLHVVGDIYATANVIAMSDQRVKRDVQPVVGALERVSALHGYTYLREERETREMGLIAQEVEAVFPEAVHYDKEQDRYGVNYNAMIAPLLEAIKELKAKVEELSQKVMM